MKIRRVLTLGLAAGALVLAGCSTRDDGGGDGGDGGDGGGGGSVDAGDIRIDVVTHAAPGDSFWDVVKAGAEQAGDDYGVDLQYNSSPDPGEQSTLIDSAVAAGTDGLVISMANPDGLEVEHPGRRRRRRPGHHDQLRHRRLAGLRRDHPRRPERDHRRRDRR